jgi:hypothetical protein
MIAFYLFYFIIRRVDYVSDEAHLHSDQRDGAFLLFCVRAYMFLSSLYPVSYLVHGRLIRNFIHDLFNFHAGTLFTLAIR